MLKILFISSSGEIDYQCHCLFHGLHELNNVTVYTLYDQPFMFADYPFDKRSELYGMGFTLAAKIDPNKQHPQNYEEVHKCIKKHFYDLVIYGSIHRCLDLWDLVIEYYSKSQIICIDGEDWTYPYLDSKNLRETKFYYHLGKITHKESFLLGWTLNQQREKTLQICSENAIMFKRELDKKEYPSILPISFAIPQSIVLRKVPSKRRRLAQIIPGKKETYIYKTENAYYGGYQEAIWGMTFKKAGWDCMRHYEILANGCIPYFPDINSCPNEIMVAFPKSIIKYTNIMYEHGVDGGKEVDYYLEELLDYTNAFLTTESLAKYVLSFVQQ